MCLVPINLGYVLMWMECFFFFLVLIGVNCIDFLFVFKLSCFFLNFLGGTSLLNVPTCLIYVSFCGNI